MAEGQRVNPGDKLQVFAGDWNRMLAASTGYFEDAAFGTNPQLARRNTGIIRLFNDHTEPVERFHPLAIDGILFEPIDGEDEEEVFNLPTFIGVEPGLFRVGKFAIAQEVILPGEIGFACISGFTIARVTDGQGVIEDCLFADITDDESKLVTSYAGKAQILWQEGSTGDRWAYVQLGPRTPPPMLTGSLASDLSISAFGGGGACWAMMNVDRTPFCKTSPLMTEFQPIAVRVFADSKWLGSFGSIVTGGFIPAGTNGTAMLIANKGGYSFAPTCDNGIITDYYPSGSGSGDPPPPEFEPAFYCITNGSVTCCMFLTTEADLPPGYTTASGPYVNSNCDLACAACE